MKSTETSVSGGMGPEKRDSWNTRGAFVLAAIGSAVGLGNLWGFPYKVYSYGGGAFLVPYFIAMAVMGFPLLVMEFAAGHWSQQSPPGAFAEINGRYRFVGWWLAAVAFVIITYYTVILGYCLIFLGESLSAVTGLSALPWSGSTEAAKSHFFTGMLAYSDGMRIGGLRLWLVAANVASWLLIYLCLFRGVGQVSKVVLITVPLPWMMLMILTARGITLDGAATGLRFYLEPDWSKLADAATWRWAFGQVFFSMSLGFAVMLSYASFLHRKSDLNNSALITTLSDLGTSIVCGIAVFSTLGAMAKADNLPIDKVVSGGPGLAFVTFPYALSRLPAGQELFSLIFFVALLTLGIDSAFSIVEACLASVHDSKPAWPRKRILPVICLVGFLAGVVFCGSGGGLNLLGLVDGLVNGPLGILTLALAECIVIGWAYGGRFVRAMRDHANERSDWQLGRWWEVFVRYVAPAFLVILIAWSVSDSVRGRNWGDLAGSAVLGALPFVLWFFVSREPDTVHHPTERIPGEDRGKPLTALFVLVAASIAVGVALGLRPAPSPAAGGAAAGSVFKAESMGTTSFVMLAFAGLTVFGGLVWCWWKAIEASGRRDPELQDSE